MKEVTYKIVSYCEIPEDLTWRHHMSEYQNGCYVPFKLKPLGKDEISDWIREKYPEIGDEEFLIDIDY